MPTQSPGTSYGSPGAIARGEPASSPHAHLGMSTQSKDMDFSHHVLPLQNGLYTSCTLPKHETRALRGTSMPRTSYVTVETQGLENEPSETCFVTSSLKHQEMLIWTSSGCTDELVRRRHQERAHVEALRCFEILKENPTQEKYSRRFLTIYKCLVFKTRASPVSYPRLFTTSDPYGMSMILVDQNLASQRTCDAMLLKEMGDKSSVIALANNPRIAPEPLVSAPQVPTEREHCRVLKLDQSC